MLDLPENVCRDLNTLAYFVALPVPKQKKFYSTAGTRVSLEMTVSSPFEPVLERKLSKNRLEPVRTGSVICTLRPVYIVKDWLAFSRGVRYLTGVNLNVVWAEFSTLSLAVW